MSVFTNEEFWASTHCTYERSAVSPWLLVFYTVHTYAVWFIFALGFLYTKQLSLVLLTLGATVNWWLNYLLLWLFMAPVPVPACSANVHTYFCIDPTSFVAPGVLHNACGTSPAPVFAPSDATCGTAMTPACDPYAGDVPGDVPSPDPWLTRSAHRCVACGMPALEPQISAFLVTALAIFVLQFRAPYARFLHAAALVTGYVLVMYTHLYFGFNDVPQVVSGATVGALTAALWQALVYALVYPRFDAILRWRLVRALGYRDTLCRSLEPVPGDPEPWAVDGKIVYEQFT